MSAFLTTAGIGSNTVLSGGNLTATQTNALFYGGARADLLHATGKWWFEVNLSAITGGVGMAVGVVGSATPNYNNIAGNAFQSAVAYLRSGSIWVMGGSAGSVSCPVCAGTLMVAADLDNNKIWFKTEDNPTTAGYWNGSSTANPDTNVGGINISGVNALLPGVYPVVEIYGTSVTFNFNVSSSHILTPPTTYAIWGGTVPAPIRHLKAAQGLAPFNQVFTLTTVPLPVNLTVAATEAPDTCAIVMYPAPGFDIAATEAADTCHMEVASVVLPVPLLDGEYVYVAGEGNTIVPADSIKRGSENTPIQVPEETLVIMVPVTEL